MVGPAQNRQNNFGMGMGQQQQMQRSNTGSLFADDVKPHPGMMGRSQSMSRQMTMQQNPVGF